MEPLTTVTFRGVELKLSTKERLLHTLDTASVTHPVRLATVNPEFIELAQRHTAFRTALNAMTHALIDGSGLFFALGLLKKIKPNPFPLVRYAGSDLVQDLFRRYSHGEKSFFFLGGAPGVMEQAAKHIKKRHPELTIVGVQDGGRVSAEQGSLTADLEEKLRKAKPDILLVAFGAPKQELWIHAAQNLPIPVMIGIGGSLDFHILKKRAPKLVRALHFEWLYRGLTEKGHGRRLVTAVPVFTLRSVSWLIKEGLRSRNQ